MSTVRLRRLQADSEKLHDYVRRHPRVRLIQKDGDPPERYQLEYRIKSLRMVGGELQPVSQHLVEVALPLNYPRTPPQCRMLSPVFHPNIAPHAICVGDHWAAGESLESIVIRIGEMLAYQSYNVKSPLNGEAARWVEEHKDQLPLDPVSLLPEGEENGHAPSAASIPPATRVTPATTPVAPVAPVVKEQPSVPSAPSPAAAAATPAKSIGKVQCPECKAEYKLTAAMQGKRVRCSKCGNVFACT
jgi:predicted Zn finger-like uncharacterized protein